MKYLLNKGRCDSPTPFYLLAAFVFFVILGMNAFLIKVITSDRETSGELANSTSSEISEPLPKNLISLDKVKNLAGEASPNNGISSVELEQRNGQLVYLIRLVSGEKLAFDAMSGARISQNTYDDKPQEKALPTSFDSSLDFSKIMEIATTDKPDVEIDKIELGQEGEEVIYSVYFVDESRTDISASGEIVRREAVPESTTPVESTPEIPPEEVTPLQTEPAESDDTNPTGTF